MATDPRLKIIVPCTFYVWGDEVRALITALITDRQVELPHGLDAHVALLNWQVRKKTAAQLSHQLGDEALAASIDEMTGPMPALDEASQGILGAAEAILACLETKGGVA